MKYLAISTLTVEVSNKKKIHVNKKIEICLVMFIVFIHAILCVYVHIYTRILQKFIWAPHCLKSIHTIYSYSNETYSLLL